MMQQTSFYFSDLKQHRFLKGSLLPRWSFRSAESVVQTATKGSHSDQIPCLIVAIRLRLAEDGHPTSKRNVLEMKR